MSNLFNVDSALMSSISARVDKEAEDVRRFNGYLRSIIEGVKLEMLDICFVVAHIHNEAIEPLIPCGLKLREIFKIQLTDEWLDLLYDNYEGNIQMEMMALVALNSKTKLKANVRRDLRKFLDVVASLSLAEIQKHKQAFRGYLAEVQSEQEKSMLGKVYDVMKYLTTTAVQNKEILGSLFNLMNLLLNQQRIQTQLQSSGDALPLPQKGESKRIE